MVLVTKMHSSDVCGLRSVFKLQCCLVYFGKIFEFPNQEIKQIFDSIHKKGFELGNLGSVHAAAMFVYSKIENWE